MTAPLSKSVCLPPAAKLAALFCMFMLSLVANLLAQQEDQALATARSLIQENKYQEAIVHLKDLAASHPGTKGISHELGTAYYYQADYFEAAAYLEEALRESSEDRDAAQLLGLSYYFSGKPAQAIPVLEKVRLWHPNENIDAIYVLRNRNILINRLFYGLQTLQYIVLKIIVARFFAFISSFLAPILQAAVIVPNAANVRIVSNGRVTMGMNLVWLRRILT